MVRSRSDKDSPPVGGVGGSDVVDVVDTCECSADGGIEDGREEDDATDALLEPLMVRITSAAAGGIKAMLPLELLPELGPSD